MSSDNREASVVKREERDGGQPEGGIVNPPDVIKAGRDIRPISIAPRDAELLDHLATIRGTAPAGENLKADSCEPAAPESLYSQSLEFAVVGTMKPDSDSPTPQSDDHPPLHATRTTSDASDAEPPRVDPSIHEPWTCRFCEYDNDASVTLCVSCDRGRFKPAKPATLHASRTTSDAEAAAPAGFFAVPADMAKGWDCPECSRQHIKVTSTCCCGFMATRYTVAAEPAAQPCQECLPGQGHNAPATSEHEPRTTSDAPYADPPRAGKLPSSGFGRVASADDELIAELRSELAATAQAVADAEDGIRLRDETIAHLRTAVAHRLGTGCRCESCCAVRLMGLDLNRETSPTQSPVLSPQSSALSTQHSEGVS